MTDKEQIDQLCKAFFDLFTNTNGKVPDLDIIYKLCISQAIIIKKEGRAETVYNLSFFIEPRKKILTEGTLIDFKEWENEESTVISKNIAQRFSRYQKSGILNGDSFNQQGTKFFQFIKSNNEWRITSLVWEDF
jgi:hypothetical protein